MTEALGKFGDFQPTSCHISGKKLRVGPRLLLITNKKLHACFLVVPKWTTLDDSCGYYALWYTNCVFFGTDHGNLEEDGPILSATYM